MSPDLKDRRIIAIAPSNDRTFEGVMVLCDDGTLWEHGYRGPEHKKGWWQIEHPFQTGKSASENWSEPQ